MVMAHHGAQKLTLPAQSPGVQEAQLFLLTGSAGVAVFFVLSGYLLAMPFWKAWSADQKCPSLGVYALRRWARIAPAFWLNLTLTFVLSLFLVPGAPDLVWRFVAGLTFTSSFTWQTLFPVEINGPLWSIGYEVVSYALLALFAALWFFVPGRRTLVRGLGWWAGVWALAVAVHLALLAWAQPDSWGRSWDFGMVGGAKYWWPAYNPVGFFATFVFGVIAAGVTQALSRQNPQGLARWVPDLVGWVALVAGVLLLWNLRHEGDFAFSWPKQPYYFPTFPFLAAVILAVAPASRVLARVLDNPVARFLATISFGLYIWHYLLLELSKGLWPNMVYFGVPDLGEWALRIGLVYGASAVLATLSWYFFERPIVTWSQRKGT